MLAIEAEGLRRVFRPKRRLLSRGPERVAVDGVDLAVERGTIFGLLGPNGAGKTTTIKMLSTLLIPSGGRARVAGYDVVRQEREVRRRLGVLLGGDRGLYAKISARDNLRYFAHLYGLWEQPAARVDELLALVGLSDRADERVETYSRGMKQRLHLARALLHDPPVIFLDEPTIGLDPAAAVNLRAIVESLVPAHTVLLTTHYLFEAEELCDRIAIIDQGRILVEDTPAGLKRRVGGDQRYRFTVRGDDPAVRDALRALPAVRELAGARADDGWVYTLRCAPDAPILDEAMQIIHGRGMRMTAVETLEPTLEDAFLALTEGAEACKTA